MRHRRISAVIVGLAGALVLTSCANYGGVYNMPLPGGADLGDHPYTVRAQFRDVLDLVPQSAVKVNEVAVGRVAQIGLAPDGWTAEVTLEVNGDVVLPANSFANLRQSSLLGEKYVELSPPPQGQERGRLGNNSMITLDHTNRNTEVEEVLGALSMVLNGGGVEQLQTITKELGAAAKGNEPEIRALLTNVNTLVSTLDARKGDITKALDGLNRLAATLNGQRDQIGNVIDNLGPGLRVITEQRDQLVNMLESLDNLSGVAVDTIDKSKQDLVADLEAIKPSLQKLADAGQDLPNALQLLVTFPFTDSAVPAVKSDYVNLYAKLDLNLEEIVKNQLRSSQNPLQDVPIVGDLTSSLPLPTTQDNNPKSGSGAGSSTGFGGILGSLLGGGN